MSATAGSRAKASTSSATGSKPDGRAFTPVFAGYRDVRNKSLARLKERIRKTTKRTRGESLARIAADLKAMLRGWFGYFKHAHASTFKALDGYIRRRLRALRRKQQKRPGSGKSYSDHFRWPNAFFADAGLLALFAAWQTARPSR
jgi:RNA-directed DNA polymerase